MPPDWPQNFTLATTSSFATDFPNFQPHHCDPNNISDFDTLYNCIAWAASDTQNWWWPDDPDIGDGYWPQGVPRELTIAAFVAAFQTLGYTECTNGLLENGFEKIAIYADANLEPTHAARQLSDGMWTSKFGDFEDVRHVDLACIEGPLYGVATVYMRRGIM